jgi:orotate phosphoribosyltransferase
MRTEEIAERFDALGVRRSGHFALSSGAHSDTYLQCAAALADPGTALAFGRALAERISAEVDVVASPALGGVLAGFAVAAALDRRFVFYERPPGGRFALRRGQVIAAGERVLVVEDVITTGGSAREVMDLIEAVEGEVAGLASLVDRSSLPEAERPVSLLRVEAQTWPAEGCPLCRSDIPIDKPGSRTVTPAAHKVQLGRQRR